MLRVEPAVHPLVQGICLIEVGFLMDENGTITEDQVDQKTAKLFPASRNELSQLGQVATEAARDVKDCVSNHADRAKKHLSNLAGHARVEGSAHFEEMKTKAGTIRDQTSELFAKRPLLAIGTALALGLLIAYVIPRRQGNTES